MDIKKWVEKKNGNEENYEIDIGFDEDLDTDINIVELFKDHAMTETSSGDFKMNCPDCGPQGGRTQGFMLFPKSNSAFCHSSGKWFRLLEAYALKKKVIRCLDGREKGDKDSKILAGELFTMALEEFRNEFGTTKYDELSDQLHIKTKIELPGNDRYVSTFADQLGEIYKSRNTLFFRGESKEVVEIRRYQKIDKDGVEYAETGFESVDSARFVTLIEMFVKPWGTIMLKTGNKMPVNKSMTSSTSSVVLKSANFQNRIPSINRLFDIPIPILYNKTLTFPKKGYDKRFGSWLPRNAPELIKQDLTVEEAKQIIGKIFEEFCFADEKDRTHAIAGFLTPFLRGLLPSFTTRTPVFIYMANRERAGKDYCAGCTGMLYEGAKIEQPAICNDEAGSNNEELRKKITACMRQGKKRFHSANNKGLLNNSIFEGVTTAEVWEDRMLGKSEVLTFANEMEYSLSGNLGIKLTPDMSNRARIVNLHLVDEDANARKFKNPDLHGWIMKNREIIISSLYTLVRNWVEKGMPDGSVPFTSFPDWARVCGGVMESANYSNPCEPDKTAIVSLDTETEEMKILFETAYALFPEKWIDRKKLQDTIENEGIMENLDLTEKSDRIKLGLKIDKFSKRVLSGIYMDVDSLEKRGSRRNYKFTKNSPYLPKNKHSIGKEGVAESISENKDSKTLFIEHDKKIKNLVKNGEKSEKSGIVGIVGIDDHVSCIFTNSKNRSIGESMPSMPTMPNPKIVPVEMEVLTNSKIKDKVVKKMSLDDISNLTKESKALRDAKKQINNEPKEKTDRELQFFESPECEEIKIDCTKEEVLEWLKKHPGKDYKLMGKELGMGTLKHIVDLFNEKIIIEKDKGWEVSDETN